MSDELVPRVLAPETELENETPPTPAEHTMLVELGSLLTLASQFELSTEARQRGLAELDVHLEARATQRRRARPVLSLWWALPVAAAVAIAWLLPLAPEKMAVPRQTPALLEAQNAHLTARLTGAPLFRDDLERARASYRQELLATLEKGR